jgi:hypothetical protein
MKNLNFYLIQRWRCEISVHNSALSATLQTYKTVAEVRTNKVRICSCGPLELDLQLSAGSDSDPGKIRVYLLKRRSESEKIISDPHPKVAGSNPA